MPKRDARELAAIFTGGALGGLLRTGLGQAFPTSAGAWPWTTLAINVAGAFALGYFITRLHERLPLSAYRRPLLGTGLCGAFTTFSTVQIELLELLDARRYATAAGYAAVTIVGGYFAIVFATALVRRTRVVT
jgi:CrcB protein